MQSSKNNGDNFNENISIDLKFLDRPDEHLILQYYIAGKLDFNVWKTCLLLGIECFNEEETLIKAFSFSATSFCQAELF